MRKLLTFLFAALMSVGMWADPTIYSGFTVTASSGGLENHEAAKLVDGKFSAGTEGTDWTKWSAEKSMRSNPSGGPGLFWWVDFESDEPIAITGYILTSSDQLGQTPTTWTLDAKLNEGDDWTTITGVLENNTLGANTLTDISFNLDNPGTYQYFRFKVSMVDDPWVNGMQLSELRFTGADGGGSTPEPDPEPSDYSIALDDASIADKVTLSANESEAGQTVTVAPAEGYEITSLTVSYLTNNYSVRVKEEYYGDIEDVDPQVITLPHEFTAYPQTGDDGTYTYNDIIGGDDKVEYVSGTDNTLTFRVTGAFDGIASIEYEYYTQECYWDDELGEDFCWDQTSIQDIQVACSQIGGNADVSENAGVYSFTMPAGNVTITAMVEAIAAPDFAGEGTQANPYRITSAADWNIFATRVSEGTTYSGVYFQLTNDIAISTMVGTDMDHAFNGTFDGDGHTITATLNSSAAYCAPFAFTYGATIKNLHTTGTINTSNSNAGGVVGRNGTASLTLTNVSCDMTINSTKSGNASHGGLMGYAINATVSGCAFTGRLLGESSSRFGGMLGWKSNTDNSSVNFTDCLFAPTQVTMSASNSKTFAVIGGAGTTVNLTNCYYTQDVSADQGKQMRAISAGTGVTVTNAGAATVYNVSGITSYGTGIKYNNVLYGGNADALSLTLSGSDYGYTASTGTLSGDANPYTLTMADAACEIQAQAAPEPQGVEITGGHDLEHPAYYYSTFYDSSVKYALPAGVEAYIATISGNDLLMNKIAVAGQTIPADNAVILKSTVNPFTLTVSDATPVTFSDANSLQGTDVAIATPANCYVLNGKNGVGFYLYNGAELNPHKAYVIFNGSFAPQRMRFIFQEEQNTTAVDNAEAENTQTIKVIENGALYIIKDGVRYNAQGQIVEL